MKPLKIGDSIPSFMLNNQFGDLVNIEDYKGSKNLVIFFYPKDEMPACVIEVCTFRDAYEEFLEYNAEVIGISADDEDKHRTFALRHRLQYGLLSDKGDRIRKLFGVPGSYFGLYPGRVTYIVDKKGVIRYIFNSQYRAKRHISKALEILKEIKND